MVVHPDKGGNLPADQRYIGRRVFEAINEAYHEFEAKEGANLQTFFYLTVNYIFVLGTHCHFATVT